MKKPVTYKDSGVDIAAGNKAVELIRDKVQKTFRHFPGKVITNLGGFSGVCRMRNGSVIGACTDGVGTKLYYAIYLDRHETVGIDLVAMCVNDLIACGLEPAFVLDYMAQGRQIPERTNKVVGGIVDGCNQAKCALIGGEMAELPGMYAESDYDLAAFAVGFAPSDKSLILGKDIKPDMNLFGLPSSGLHSNGHSLARRVFGLATGSKVMTLDELNKYYPELNRTLGEELLEPTKIYVRKVERLIKSNDILGMANITGGGLKENSPRMLPKGCGLEIKTSSWQRPAIFDLLQERGNVEESEMRLTFNLGIGYVLVSPNDHLPGAIKIGRVIKSDERKVQFIK